MTAAPAPAYPAMSIAEAHRLLVQPGSMFEIAEAEVRGVRTKIWKNAPPTLAEIYALGQAWGAREHLIYEIERVTFAALRKAVAHLAARLTADGVNKGDRVALVMRNLPEWAAAFWAGALIGAIVTPLNAWWTGPELEFGLKDCGASILIADIERWERVREHLDACPALNKIYVSRSREDIADPKVERLESVIGPPQAWGGLSEAPSPHAQLAPDDDVTIFYTSGTTGKPKGAVISHRNIIANIMNGLCAQARAFLRRGEAPPTPDPVAPQRIVLVSIPFFHATGAFAVLAPALMGGYKLILQRRWDPDAALDLIARERITHCGGVPTIAWQLLEHPRFAEHDLSSLEDIGYGGAPAAPELVRRIKQLFPKATPRQGWGMTETAATAVSNAAEDYEAKPWSAGVAPPTGEIRIVAPGGASLPVGEVGEIWYKGPVVARGYWNNPAATAETFVDGWVKTGDLGKLDAEGFLTVVDRAKDMLIRGGENIYCVEVENALYDHEAVMDAAVIGRPHPSLGEEPLAVVCLKPGMSATADELRHHVAQKLAAFKVPVDVVFWPETLPRNANGKIVKPELKAKLEHR